jgi:glycerophosphoryl diester phosphodiesterase
MVVPVERPLIIAHRGASRERPENTLAAFARAVELGADGVELDVHRTVDGVLVVHHDYWLADGRPITSLSWTDLDGIRVRGEPIPRLESVFDTVAGRLRVHVELKGRDTAADASRIITGMASPGQGAVHAFDHRLMATARSIAPTIPRGVLEVSYTIDLLAAARSVDARDVWRHLEFIDEPLVAAAHAEGRRVIAWTVNQADHMTQLARIGVDGICTDDVALARRTLGA